jgi:hypothetical protein
MESENLNRQSDLLRMAMKEMLATRNKIVARNGVDVALSCPVNTSRDAGFWPGAALNRADDPS